MKTKYIMNIQLDKVQPKNRIQLKQIIKYAFKHNIYDLNFIDVSKITDMYKIFSGINYNFDVSGWDVSNVTDMFNMFSRCDSFNCNLSNWDVSKVIDMSFMFSKCKNFEGKGLENWNVSNVEDFKEMFYRCSKITIPSWYKKL